MLIITNYLTSNLMTNFTQDLSLTDKQKFLATLDRLGVSYTKDYTRDEDGIIGIDDGNGVVWFSKKTGALI